MTTSKSISSGLLKQLDELFLPQHRFLKADDEIYYLGEYTPGKLSDHSRTNRLIINYEKELTQKGKLGWEYKEKAIKQAANQFMLSIMGAADLCHRVKNTILVPIPTSKGRNTPEFDDRNIQLLKNFSPQGNMQELVRQPESRESFKKGGLRDPKKLQEGYTLHLPDAPIDEIWLFDDVLTAGTHFRAIHDLLKQAYPNARIVGFFIARTTRET